MLSRHAIWDRSPELRNLRHAGRALSWVGALLVTAMTFLPTAAVAARPASRAEARAIRRTLGEPVGDVVVSTKGSYARGFVSGRNVQQAEALVQKHSEHWRVASWSLESEGMPCSVPTSVAHDLGLYRYTGRSELCITGDMLRDVAPVFAAGYGPFAQRPYTLALWASDALIDLRWQSWGNAVAIASGRETSHSGGRYQSHPAQVQLSQIQLCGGRQVYTHVRYRAGGGTWVSGRRNGCRLSA